MQEALQWAQPVVTVISLTFGGGILYGDVQELKQTVEKGLVLDKQVQVMEVKLSNAESDQRKTVEALVKVADAVNKLNTSVAKLESKLEK